MANFNLLSISTNYIDFAVEKISSTDLNFLGQLIRWLIEGVSIIGVGIILFTVILKTAVLPLDIYSRYKMKKQSLVMKAVRPQMEKLQKQYANDKQMYNQKVMELQKANGISMFGACLPMIVSLVIFMVVFNAFSAYSRYANLQAYKGMEIAYNKSVSQYVKDDINEEGFLIKTQDSSIDASAYFVEFDAFKLALKEKQSDFDETQFDGFNEAQKMAVVREFVREGARKKSADYYRANKNNFLWVKNIWYPDSPMNKEVPNFKDFNSAISGNSSSNAGSLSATYEESYNEVTYYLRNEGYPDDGGNIEGNGVNGYFILIVVAIGLMLLQQFISMRTQKDANELSSVDGMGAKTNKWMLIMMPLIYGIFSFFYSAAFSIYMVTNTVYGLVVMLIINKIMDSKFEKKQASGELFKKIKKDK